MTWRSLGDSNPCFRRERVNTCISANTGDRQETATSSAFLAFSVRRGTLPFVHRYSPKTPQKSEGRKMARTVRDANLETRTARLRLPIRSEPSWRGLEKGFALGYRRGGKGGTWLARRRPADGGYVEHKIGSSDDLQDADGVAILDYGQAQKAARTWWRAELRREEGPDTREGPFTVRDAIDDYLKAYEQRGGKAVYDARRAAETHILPALGTALASKLTAKNIEDWHRGLAAKPALARSKPGRKPNHRKIDRSADGIRKRRATANRILTVLKAALNHAWKSGHVASDDAWRRVKPFRAVETARVRYLSEAECVRLVNACEPAFRNLVRLSARSQSRGLGGGPSTCRSDRRLSPEVLKSIRRKRRVAHGVLDVLVPEPGL